MQQLLRCLQELCDGERHMMRGTFVRSELTVDWYSHAQDEVNRVEVPHTSTFGIHPSVQRLRYKSSVRAATTTRGHTGAILHNNIIQ
jgi:hypothetical protein